MVSVPKSIQQILDGDNETAPSFCEHCRQPAATLPCSSCKLVKFCSVDCQKRHCQSHEGVCMAIKKKLDEMENYPMEYWGRNKWEIGVIRMAGGLDVYTLSSFFVDFANLLVQAGHYEYDRLEHGYLYYREALKYYLEPMKYMGVEEYHRYCAYLDDRILLLLIILGGNETEIYEWCVGTMSKRATNYSPTDLTMSESEDGISFQIMGFARNDFAFQSMLLLCLMKVYTNYVHDLEGLDHYKEVMQSSAKAIGYDKSLHDVFKAVTPFLMGEKDDHGRDEVGQLQAKIALVISAIRHHGNISCLEHLVDNTFKKQHAHNKLFDYEGTPVMHHTPPEFWAIFQDCFIQTDGLCDILRGFLT